jgi:hypothetical protein
MFSVVIFNFTLKFDLEVLDAVDELVVKVQVGFFSLEKQEALALFGDFLLLLLNLLSELCLFFSNLGIISGLLLLLKLLLYLDFSTFTYQTNIKYR